MSGDAERKARRRRMAIWTLAILLLVPAVAINVVNRIETEVPPPLWTADHFVEPEAEDNGWPLISHYHATTISGIDLEPIDNLLSASRDNGLVELGRVFAPARSVASKVRPHTKVCGDAFARKRMVIPCLEIEENACSTEALGICSRLTTFAALDAASRGSPAGVQKMSNVLRALNDAAANSPHPWVQARALVMLRSAIHHAAAIIKWRRGNTAPLRAAVKAISDDSLPLMQLVVASYLLKHMALRRALDQADTWLLDEGSVMRGLNAPFEAVQAGGELAPPVEHTKGLFWWFDNPIGKKMLAAVKPGADEDFARTRDLRATVLKRREETLRLGKPKRPQ